MGNAWLCGSEEVKSCLGRWGGLLAHSGWEQGVLSVFQQRQGYSQPDCRARPFFRPLRLLCWPGYKAFLTGEVAAGCSLHGFPIASAHQALPSWPWHCSVRAQTGSWPFRGWIPLALEQAVLVAGASEPAQSTAALGRADAQEAPRPNEQTC